MLGPYEAKKDGAIKYLGNKIFSPIENIKKVSPPIEEFEKRVEQFAKNKMWGHIAKINHSINKSINDFFTSKGAIFTLLPMTTRMISSPGAVYGKESINYTTDTCPITLKWFNLQRKAFLSESSQIYLELALIQNGIDHVYSFYNSFRKEKADPTHLSEFHHVEYEGKIDQEKNEGMVLDLLKKIVGDLLKNNLSDLEFFLTPKKIGKLKEFVRGIKKVPKITFKEALDILYEDTGNKKYKEFSLKNFGEWEEIRITNILKNLVIITEFPLLEVPFYHAVIDGKDPPVANNADFIWPGYREIVGSGHRVRSEKELEEKGKIFNLPKKDYLPYYQSRKLKKYVETSGFGLGWERLLQGILEMPFIWSANHFPRVDKTLKP